MNVLALLTILAVVPQQKPAPAGPDLSTPEQTVRSFLKAIYTGHIKTALICVAGTVLDPRLDAMEADIQSHQGQMKEDPNAIKIETIKVDVNGDSATANVKYYGPQQRGMALEEKIPLKQVGADWKIVPLPKAELNKLVHEMDSNPKAGVPPVALMASSISDTETLFRARDAALATSCLSNLKQLCTALLMFLQDYDEKYNLRADSYKAKIMPYCKSERLFHCQSDKSGAVSYSFNANLQGIKASAVKYPAKTVLLYEGKGGKLDYRHDGRATVGFADGHCRLINKQDAASLRWTP